MRAFCELAADWRRNVATGPSLPATPVTVSVGAAHAHMTADAPHTHATLRHDRAITTFDRKDAFDARKHCPRRAFSENNGRRRDYTCEVLFKQDTPFGVSRPAKRRPGGTR